MRLQDICRDEEEHCRWRFVCDYHRFSTPAWDMDDSSGSEEGRYDYSAARSKELLSLIALVQRKRSRHYLLTHTTCVYLSGTGTWKSRIQQSLCAMVRRDYIESSLG